MSGRDDDRFRPKPRPPRAPGGARGQRFLTRVLTEMNTAGPLAGRTPTRASRRSGARSGRGPVAARLRRDLGPHARRVVVKVRLVQLKAAGSPAVIAHLRYIVRDGITRKGEPGQAYGLSDRGFGAAMRDALARREEFLVSQNLAERRGERVVLARNLLGTLRKREIDEIAKRIATEAGLTHRPALGQVRVDGVYPNAIRAAATYRSG